eukprot:15838_1
MTYGCFFLWHDIFTQTKTFFELDLNSTCVDMSIQKPRGSVLKRTQLSSLTKFRSQLHTEQQQQQQSRPLQTTNTNLNRNNRSRNRNTLPHSTRLRSTSKERNISENSSVSNESDFRSQTTQRRDRRGRNRHSNKENVTSNNRTAGRRDTARSKSRTRNNGYKKPLNFQEMKDKLKALRKEISEVNEVNDRLNEQIQDLEDELGDINQRHSFEAEQKDNRIQELTQNLQQTQSENNEKTQNLFKQKSQIQMKQNEVEMLQSTKRTLEQQVMTLTQSMKMKECQIQNHERQLSMIKSENTMVRKECQTKHDQIETLTHNLQRTQSENESHVAQIKGLRGDNMTITLKNTSLNNMNENQLRKIGQLTDTVHKQEEEIAFRSERMQRMNDEHHRVTQRKNMLERENGQQSQQIQQQKQQINELERKCAWYEERARKDEEVRKRLHNQIQELKGNIRVFCRVRPMLDDAKQDGMVYEFDNDDIEEQSITLSTAARTQSGYSGQWSDGKNYKFDFDRVFRPFSTQQSVFNEISQLVQSALDGYKVCIFAYGQTGSGKTYTMEGPSLNRHDENRGMIPRSVEKIFEHGNKLREKGWQYECTATYLEIYNEKIRDLLSNNHAAQQGPQHAFNSRFCHPNDAPIRYLEIRQKKSNQNSKKTDIYVEGLTHVPVASSSDVYPLLSLASTNRSVGKTDCNERSSRSHSVFQLFLNGTNPVTRQSTFGVLNLIDLAGSERLKKSNAIGQQLKETQNINKSLSCLGDVIAALSSKKGRSHIPYRNSKLTYLLMNYFGGDAKTLMFVNLCPEKDRSDESLCSLRFAAKVNDCQIGIAKRTVANC